MFKKRHAVFLSWQGWVVLLGGSMILASIFSGIAGISVGWPTTIGGFILGGALVIVGIIKR